MKSFVAMAAFAAGTNALVGRSDNCCFHLTSTGDLSGDLGQLGDGQVRIGDNTLPKSTFCIDSNGGISDSSGRGCIITPPTTQFQCDEGATPTPGFSVSSSGQLEFNNTAAFIACQTGQNDGRNVYTTNSTSVTGCSSIQLNADSCSGSGAGSGGASPSGSAPSGAASSGRGGVAPSGTSPGGSSPSGGKSPGVTSPGSAAPSGGASAGGGAPSGTSPGGSSPSGGASPVVTSTGGAAPSGGASPGGESPGSSPGGGSGSSGMTPSGGGGSPGGTSPGGGSPAGESTTQICSCAAPGGGSPGGSSPGGSSPSGGGGSPGGGSPGGGSPGSGGSSPGGSSGGTSPTGSPSSGGGGGSPGGGISSPGGGSPTSVPGGGVQPSSSGGGSKPTGTASVFATSASSTPSSSGSSSGSCPTDLSGNYEKPHLIVALDSSSPDTAPGTGFNGTVTSTVSSVFNFDIPASDTGKTCSLVFLFPQKQDLETSSFSFSGDGKIDFAKLSGAVSTSTTPNNLPSVGQDLGTITVSPGNSYVVSTFACPGDQSVAFEMKNAGSTELNFFEDYNPSPLGLFITVC
ncbi:unnamed protein product [Penicillium pancosmium]